MSKNTYKNSLLEKLLIKDSIATHATNLILENGIKIQACLRASEKYVKKNEL